MKLENLNSVEIITLKGGIRYPDDCMQSIDENSEKKDIDSNSGDNYCY